jgi:DNA-binding LytR/AlgR family response regulator
MSEETAVPSVRGGSFHKEGVAKEEKMRIAICDDDRNIVEEVQQYIMEIQKQLDVDLELYLFSKANELTNDIHEDKQYDAVILDIEIGNENGIELAKKIKKKYPTTAIIFMTGYHQYVYDVFDVQPCGFLKKPIKKEQVFHVITKAVELCDESPVLTYSKGGSQYKVYLKDVACITSDKREIVLHTVYGEKSYYGKLDEIEQTLQNQSKSFVRVGQSVIINMHYLTEISYCELSISVNDKIERFNISQKYRPYVRKKCFPLWKLS